MTNEETKLLTETCQRAKSNTHRIEDIEKRQDNLDNFVTSVAVMTREQEHIKDDVTEIKTDVKTLTEKPAKRWEGVVEKILYAAFVIMVGFLLAQMGVK